MFYEDFELQPLPDSPMAEYTSDTLIICYNMPAFTEGGPSLIETITHEWLHGLIDWALEGHPFKGYIDKHDEKSDGDHFIMRVINWV